MADRGKEGTTMYQKNELLYWILDDNGNKIGVPIKASVLVSRPTIKNLQSKFQTNEQFRPMYKERLTKVIDSFFDAIDRQTRVNFSDYLNFYSINPVFRENNGITFIDNRKGAVINGSELGKKYSGQALVKRFKVPIAPDSRSGRTAGERERQEWVHRRLESPQLEKHDHSQANRTKDITPEILELIKAEKLFAEPENPNFRRRKKKRRGMSR